jgi:UDP-GlcNAc:undecaprenyl-phosphate GlcNAc-1-phosphate transferase
VQSVLLVLVVSFCVATLAVGWLARARSARLVLDQPNDRSLHTAPVPRTGGIGLLLGIAAGWALASAHLPWAFWIAVALLIAVSFLDDYLAQGLSAALRFGAHLIAAALLVFALPGLSNHPLQAIAAVLAISWMCNLYNFMDGSDGLAGGMALFGFLSYTAAAWFADNAQFALLNLSVAAAAGGFLMHNFHPARIFLGDAGSVPLGFLAAAFGLLGWLQSIWAWWFPMLVFSPFIVDASVTLARRACAGIPIWHAHRDHYYQRLVRLGWGHRRTALAEYVLMLACGVCALAALTWQPMAQVALLVTATVVYAALIFRITRAWRKAQSEQKP